MQKKHYLVITDGMPDSVNNVDTCFNYAKSRNIEIYGLSIRSSLILKLFEKAQVLENASELEKYHLIYLVNSLIAKSIHKNLKS